MGKAPHPTAGQPETQAQEDLRDIQDGVYDAVNEDGLPRGDQPETQPLQPNLPEGLRRERKGPVNVSTGRPSTDKRK